MSRGRVVFFDEHAAWSPSLNAVTLHGGGEIHEVQICEGFARLGFEVIAFAHCGQGRTENGVTYYESRGVVDHGTGLGGVTPGQVECELLIVQTSSRIPRFHARRVLTHQIHDPRPVPHRWDHFAGQDVTHVCVSAWLAELFGRGQMAGGGAAAAIHPPLPITDTMRNATRVPHRYVTCASWNKGTDLTLELWRDLHPRMAPGSELLVGSPYSEPDDAHERCRRAGAQWLGRLRSDMIPELIATAGGGLFLANVHPETFGVTVGFARLCGVPVYIYCEREMGALGEAAGANEYVVVKDRGAFARRVLTEEQPKGFPPPDLSEEHIMAEWMRVAGLS